MSASAWRRWFGIACLSAAYAFSSAYAAGPDLSAAGMGTLNLEALRGKVVYVDFWASWCGPCAQSFPWMDGIQRQFGQDGLVVVAVNVDQVRDDAEAFLGKHPVQFRIVYDAAGHYAEQFGVHNMPTSFLIDRDGRTRVQHAGFRALDRPGLEQQIRDLLKSR